MDAKSIIKKKGLTLEQVASLMNPPITKGTLSRSLNNNPTIGTLQKIADVVGCKVGDFFTDEIDVPNGENVLICPKCGAKLELREKE